MTECFKDSVSICAPTLDARRPHLQTFDIPYSGVVFTSEDLQRDLYFLPRRAPMLFNTIRALVAYKKGTFSTHHPALRALRATALPSHRFFRNLFTTTPCFSSGNRVNNSPRRIPTSERWQSAHRLLRPLTPGNHRWRCILTLRASHEAYPIPFEWLG